MCKCWVSSTETTSTTHDSRLLAGGSSSRAWRREQQGGGEGSSSGARAAKHGEPPVTPTNRRHKRDREQSIWPCLVHRDILVLNFFCNLKSVVNNAKRANHQSFSKLVANDQLQEKRGQILEVQAKLGQILKFPHHETSESFELLICRICFHFITRYQHVDSTME